MNQKLYETQKFALNYYNKLFKARHAIDNSSPYNSKIPYSSRNTTHMTRYEEQLKTKKLLNKLIQIDLESKNIKLEKPKKSKSQNTARRKARKILRESRDKQVTKNEYSESKSFTNPPVNREKSIRIQHQNYNLVGKLLQTKSNYHKCFSESKQRDQQLKIYRKLLSKKDASFRQQNQIRDNIFSAYKKIKLTAMPQSIKRPRSSVSHKRKYSMAKTNDNAYEIKTRPQTAKN